MFFDDFEKVEYTIPRFNISKQATNITNSIVLKFQSLTNSTLYYKYTIQDGETPLTIAHKLYGNQKYHWVLILLNNIVDVYFDWPLPSQQLTHHNQTKFGATLNDVVYYHNINTGDRVDEVDEVQVRIDHAAGNLPIELFPNTNQSISIDENEKKRDILVLRKDSLRLFINQFKELLSGGDVTNIRVI